MINSKAITPFTQHSCDIHRNVRQPWNKSLKTNHFVSMYYVELCECISKNISPFQNTLVRCPFCPFLSFHYHSHSVVLRNTLPNKKQTFDWNCCFIFVASHTTFNEYILLLCRAGCFFFPVFSAARCDDLRACVSRKKLIPLYACCANARKATPNRMHCIEPIRLYPLEYEHPLDDEMVGKQSQVYIPLTFGTAFQVPRIALIFVIVDVVLRYRRVWGASLKAVREKCKKG